MSDYSFTDMLLYAMLNIFLLVRNVE